ncbi:recombinase family protein [Alicyclobacillus sp. SO9]|uniref:recombinase family protein n=1 Tax=Alicyclobacillus sp. SO9 TaxID=2665646 RepID=UPI0018E76CE0|nr:recombinase family protein [Alicyclobacillus sp. SO9]QQE80878.1 recombinase family protein [Alicyclobacillus sp. SO9]
MKAALYTRVSTDMQAEEGFSLDAQLSRLRAYCESQGWDIYDIYTDDGESAKNTQREALQRLRTHMHEQRFDVVLVYKLDRLTRNIVDLHLLIQEFEKYGVGFKSATEVFDTTTAMGRLFITIVGALAQWERENLAERTRMGQSQMVQDGKRPGANAPFGYRYEDGRLVLNEPAARVVKNIFSRYLSGDGLSKILLWLNDPTNPQVAPVSGRWTQNVLRYVLDNPVYAGYVRYGYRKRSKNDVIVEKGDHEPLVDESTWQQIVQLRQQRKRLPARAGTGTYALTGLLRCGRCGASMSGINKTARNWSRRYYICIDRIGSRTCDLPYIQERVVESALLDAVDKRYEYLKQRIPKDAPQKKRPKKSLDTELKKIEARRTRWKDAYEDGAIEAEEMRERLDVLQEREMQLRVEFEKEIEEDNTEIEMDLISRFRELWENSAYEERRQAVSLLVKQITVYSPDEIEITFI